jgi:hypothetical protein
VQNKNKKHQSNTIALEQEYLFIYRHVYIFILCEHYTQQGDSEYVYHKCHLRAASTVVSQRMPYIRLRLKSKSKGEAILQAWTGPEGSMRLTLPDFKTIGT